MGGGEDPPPSLDTERAKYAIYWGRVPQTALPGGEERPYFPSWCWWAKNTSSPTSKSSVFWPCIHHATPWPHLGTPGKIRTSRPFQTQSFDQFGRFRTLTLATMSDFSLHGTSQHGLVHSATDRQERAQLISSGPDPCLFPLGPLTCLPRAAKILV